MSATDLTFLWEECPRCFYRKIAQHQPRPRAPFPSVFGAIDRAMKDECLGRRAEQLADGAPHGVICSPDRWVKSIPMVLASCSHPVVLRGRLDALVACDDATEAVVDFKTALPGDTHVTLYGRQLHAYAWALERPAGGRPGEVSALGLLCFSPGKFEAHGPRAALLGNLRWVGVPRDDLAFEGFLTEVVCTLEAPQPPPPAEGCGWCLWCTTHPEAA